MANSLNDARQIHSDIQGALYRLRMCASLSVEIKSAIFQLERAERLANSQQQNQAYNDGVRSFELGGKLSDNPYHNTLANCWRQGYQDASDREAKIKLIGQQYDPFTFG